MFSGFIPILIYMYNVTGGGPAPVPDIRITDSLENRITDTGDIRITD